MSDVVRDVINTFTGKAFSPLNPNVGDIDIVDIAQALSNMCRFTGHVSEFYSVAEHSCYVHDVIWRRKTVSGTLEEDRRHLNTLRWALLHDAAEAYLIDVARPVKRQPQMAFYREAEDKLLTCIARRFGMIGDAPPDVVNEVDRQICKNEARLLLPNMRADLWSDERPELPDAEFTAVLRASDLARIGKEPRTARAMFLRRFWQLFPAGGA